MNNNCVKSTEDEDDIFLKEEAEISHASQDASDGVAHKLNESMIQVEISPQDASGGVAHKLNESMIQDLQLSSPRKKFIQDILDNFDLEKVMDRYRGDSVNKSLSRSKLRHWLNCTMAEDISNFNDRQWKEQCRQKVLDELERKEEEREGMLADAESQRILKLKLQGIIRYDNEEDTRTEKSTMKKTPSERRFDKRSTKKQQSLFKPNDIETQMEILNRDESEIRSRNRSRNEAYDSNGGIRGNDEETTNGEDYSALPTYKSQLGRTQADTKEVHPQLKELYEEEDLQQLYREAETLVRRTTRNK